MFRLWAKKLLREIFKNNPSPNAQEKLENQKQKDRRKIKSSNRRNNTSKGAQSRFNQLVKDALNTIDKRMIPVEHIKPKKKAHNDINKN
ncbi:hypothetical protein AGMMS49949_05370 [Alphaproteobacteria bacterium]|nr:hypothetical protein AGMMS49949_05370 [Alphaproteobacteria bacterium]GHS97503.1 hypothetical protein AGMMS50296_4540 [Alphaproteobacteria bacterium]